MKFSKIKLQMVKEKNFTYNSKTIFSNKDIVKYINEIENLDLEPDEKIILICLNNKNQIIAYSEIAKGGADFCNIDFKVLFKTILVANATKFILVHNHPTGNANPSSQDIKITEKIKDASSLLNIQFLDHIVVGENTFISCMTTN